MNWLLLLQQKGLPVISAEEVVVDGFKRVNVVYSRELTDAEKKIHHRLLLSHRLGDLEGIKEYRDSLLLSSAWTQLPDVPLSSADKAAWQTYREALQVIEFSNANPDLIVFPDPPAFVNGQPPAEVTAYRASRADLKAQADAAILRLEGYQTATPPFTQQGYTALTNAVKDMAVIEEKLLKVLRRII